VLVGFLKANRSRWSKKIRPQRGALNEGSRPSDRLLMKYSCKEWLYLSIHPSILPTTFPHFLLLPSTILWCASFERKKRKENKHSFTGTTKTNSSLPYQKKPSESLANAWFDFKPSSQKLLLFGRSSVCLGKCSQHMTANCTFTSAACMGNRSFITIP